MASVCPPTQKATPACRNARLPVGQALPRASTIFETVDECVEGTLRSSHERSGVCFGGFRPTKHVEEPRLRAVTHFGVQARASVREGSTYGNRLIQEVSLNQRSMSASSSPVFPREWIEF